MLFRSVDEGEVVALGLAEPVADGVLGSPVVAAGPDGGGLEVDLDAIEEEVLAVDAEVTEAEADGERLVEELSVLGDGESEVVEVGLSEVPEFGLRPVCGELELSVLGGGGTGEGGLVVGVVGGGDGDGVVELGSVGCGDVGVEGESHVMGGGGDACESEGGAGVGFGGEEDVAGDALFAGDLLPGLVGLAEDERVDFPEAAAFDEDEDVGLLARGDELGDVELGPEEGGVSGLGAVDEDGGVGGDAVDFEEDASDRKSVV